MATHVDPKVAEFVDGLLQAPWLGEERKHWPRYLYHITNIGNLCPILSIGYVYARQELTNRRLEFYDAAASEMVRPTRTEVKSCARLYFRPKTPTFYNNEGFRPGPQISTKYPSHMPFPVGLLFSSKEVLSLPQACFSHKSLASRKNPIICDTSELEKLDMQLTYHNKRYSIYEKTEVHSARHAEVVIAGGLSIDHLRVIMTRSEAERQTVLTLLKRTGLDGKFTRLSDVRVDVNGSYFFKDWTYVNSVHFAGGIAELRFGERSQSACPFEIQIGLGDAAGNELQSPYEVHQTTGQGVFAIELPQALREDATDLIIRLDGNLAFQGEIVWT